MFTRLNRMPVAAAIAIVIATTAGCATSVPKAKFSHAMTSASHVGVSDVAQVSVDAQDTVKIDAEEKSRLAAKLQKKIDARKLANAGSGPGRQPVAAMNSFATT